MNARIIDETEVNRWHNPGSDIVTTDIEVCVTGATSGEAARSEAEHHARQDADGELQSMQHHTTEGPMSLDGQYIIRLTTTVLRYF